jgi:NTE family protein
MTRALAACLLLLAPSLPGFSPNALPEPLSPTPRLGVALSGGGPRGRAHLGTLQALHELRIPVDLVAGTSAGSLVGALYAQSLDLDRVARELDQLDFVRLVADESIQRRRLSFRERERQINYLSGLQLSIGPSGLRARQALSSGRRLRWALRRLLAPSAGVGDFSLLPVPVRAAVTDLSAGRGRVLQGGDLAEAVMASVAVPGIFAPQHVSGAVLVDGLIFSNLPIDAVREAKTVLVVDITSLYPQGQDFNHLGAVLSGMVDTMITQNSQRQLGLLGPGDLLLRPQLEGIGNFDYHKADEALVKGRSSLLEQAERLRHLRLSDAAYAAWLAQRQALAPDPSPPRLRSIVLGPGAEGLAPEALGQREGEALDFTVLEGALEDLLGSGFYEDADFRLLPAGPGQVDLRLEPRPLQGGLSVLDLGLKLNADLEGRSEFELLLQVTQRSGPDKRQWRHQAVAGRVNGLHSELMQPLTGPLFLAPQAFVQARQVVLPGLGESQVQRAGGGMDLGAFIGRSAELRAGWHASRLWSPQWGGYYGGIVQAAWQGVLIVDSLDHPHFPSQGGYLRAQVLEARGSLQGPSAYDLARVGLHQAFSRGRLMLLLGGEWQHSFGTNLPFYEQAQLGGFLRLGGYRPGHFVGQEAWLGRVLLAWRQSRPEALVAKTLLYGVSLEAGEAGSQPWAGSGGEAYSAAAYIGLSTVLGPLYLAHARNPQGSGVSYVYLGNPF